MKKSFVTIFLLLIFCVISPRIAVATANQSSSRVVTDMADRQVTLPVQIARVATIGSVPVQNSFLFALGEGAKLVNGLPDFADNPGWKYQWVFAPHLKGLPRMQDADRIPNIEELLKAAPDVVFTMDKFALKPLQNADFQSVYLSWTQPTDVKKVMTLLGDIFSKQERAAAYIRYFDKMLDKIKVITSAVPENKKVRVLYGSLSTLSNPHLISEWWIESAGGLSVTKDIHTVAENVAFNAEQLLQWDPQVIILSVAGDLSVAYNDARFATLSAVKNKRVFIIPKGAHIWGNRTIEQPLTVFWTAKMLYPEALQDLDLHTEIKRFYSKIFGFDLTNQQIDEILSGNIKSF